MSAIKKVLLILLLTIFYNVSNGQQTPLNPISYRIFSPFVFNPAIAGSKDFFSLDMIAGFKGKSNSQIISGNARLPKKSPHYLFSSGSPEFTGIGAGGFLFNDMDGNTRNTGAAGSASYHFRLDKQALSFLSIGASFKAIYNMQSENVELGLPAKNTFYQNVDAGIYFYSPRLFAGLSSTNLLGNPEAPDSLGVYSIPVSRQFFFQFGYRFVLSRSLNILLEPSVIVNTDDSLSQEISEMIEPSLKLYAGDFCVGTYFNDFSRISFFAQYKYPKFYIGAYFELPNNSPFYKKSMTAELAFRSEFLRY